MQDRVITTGGVYSARGHIKRLSFVTIGMMILLTAFILLSLSVGAESISPSDMWRVLWVEDDSLARVIIHDLRLPRTLVAILVGANLAVAGTIMQGITRNPLTGPNIIGINSGAALMMAALTALVPGFPLVWMPPAAFGGAALGGLVVFGLASKGGMTPVKLALAGVATASMLSALTTGILVIWEQHSTVYLWLAGTLFARSWSHLRLIAPWSILGLLIACFGASRVNILALGDDVARGLGLPLERTRLFLTLVVVGLAGSAVATAGPIGFVGLMIPHIGRRFVGHDHRFLVPAAAVLGGSLLLAADILARVVIAPQEAPVGAITALLGAPFFLYLARKEG